MSTLLDTADDIRRMSNAELATLAEDGLSTRLRDQAEDARRIHGALSPSNLGTFLNDRNFVRYPTRLVFEVGEMGMNQFAQPEPDIRTPDGIMLYLRPQLGQRPDLLVQAVAYMIPVINFSKLVSDHHCLLYGAQLFGIEEDEFYQSICGLADWVGASEERLQDSPSSCDCHHC